ncbi:hypothetical protein [Streptomyces sp. NPDC058092]|uniref:hypothetical protein n=1 Tax=Streptomyces sp. NPDC058092 TaxID=3346336 RepID=UPI0036E91A58
MLQLHGLRVERGDERRIGLRQSVLRGLLRVRMPEWTNRSMPRSAYCWIRSGDLLAMSYGAHATTAHDRFAVRSVAR